MPNDFRPTKQLVALALTASYDPVTGWSLSVAEAHQGDSHVISDHMRYSGLTASELIDVIEVYASHLA